MKEQLCNSESYQLWSMLSNKILVCHKLDYNWNPSELCNVSSENAIRHWFTLQQCSICRKDRQLVQDEESLLWIIWLKRLVINFKNFLICFLRLPLSILHKVFTITLRYHKFVSTGFLNFFHNNTTHNSWGRH